jgi:anti-sigma factor RsiW
MKTCKAIKKIILEYYYDELPADETAEVRAHLKSCRACAEELKTIAAVLGKVAEVKRPVLSSSLYPAIKERIVQKKSIFGKFWNLPFAAGVGLLILLAVFSNNQNVASIKNADMDDTSIVSNVIELSGKDLDSLSSLEVEILADELFVEDNLITFGS